MAQGKFRKPLVIHLTDLETRKKSLRHERDPRGNRAGGLWLQAVENAVIGVCLCARAKTRPSRYRNLFAAPHSGGPSHGASRPMFLVQ